MPRPADYDPCAFCPRLCRHACPVAVGSGREAATPTHIMAGVWGWLQDHRPDAEARALASICTRCGACTAACKLERPVDDLLSDARGALSAPAEPPAVPTIHGDGRRVAVHTDGRAWAADLARYLGEDVAWLDTPDHLGEGVLDQPQVLEPLATGLRAQLRDRVLVVASVGALRACRALGLPHEDLGQLIAAPEGRTRVPACGRGDDPRAAQPELLACCGACEPLQSAHPDLAQEVGADQARRLAGTTGWTPDARCGDWLRRFGADVADPVRWLQSQPAPSSRRPT